jgi:predicted peroxiredoxin
MEKKKFVFIITSSHDRPDVVAGAMQLATNMKAFDMELDFFLMESGSLLARKGSPRPSRGRKRTSSRPSTSSSGLSARTSA